jgi:4-hydroxy-3-methylbut-2-enyl diphosphate reductase IspH
MKKIGVERGLSMVADYLTNQGYSVQTLGENLENNAQNLDNLDAIIVSDQNSDMMGFSDTTSRVPVINASGLTPEEVRDLVDRKTTK